MGRNSVCQSSSVKDLADFIEKHDDYRRGAVSRIRLEANVTTMLRKNRYIINVHTNGKILGYGEFWRLDYAQLGWISCYPNTWPNFEAWDIETGPICYLANVAVHKDWRKTTKLLKIMKLEFFKRNFDATFFIGHAYRKKHQPLKIFSKEKLFQYGLNRGVI